MLYDNEARVNKNNNITFGSKREDQKYIILNPIKGLYKDRIDKLKTILEKNPNTILEVKFPDNKIYYFKYINGTCYCNDIVGKLYNDEKDNIDVDTMVSEHGLTDIIVSGVILIK